MLNWNILNPLINYLNYNLLSSIASIYFYLVVFPTPLFPSVTKCCVTFTLHLFTKCLKFIIEYA